jgi:hypothetical protein
MLLGLRHHRFVGGDHQQRRVDPTDPRQHVLDEPLMARHVDDADGSPARQGEPGEAQVDRHLAAPFFFPTVGIDTGERLDQRRLAVVYVASCADHIHREEHKRTDRGALRSTAVCPTMAPCV